MTRDPPTLHGLLLYWSVASVPYRGDAMSLRSSRSKGSLLRGTLTTFRRRCGKATCHCATGDPHESPALAYTEGGRTNPPTRSQEAVAEAEAAFGRCQAAWAGLDRAA